MDQMFARNHPSHIDYDHQDKRGKFTIPSFVGSYDLEEYLDWEMVIEQEFNFHLVPEIHRVTHTTSEFKDFAEIW
jgi:hypothetical protein